MVRVNFLHLRYKIEKIGIELRPDQTRFGMFVQVDSAVHVSKSQWTISPMTFLTRIGGVVGVGKELMWILISIIGFIMTIFQKFRPKI